MFEKVNPSHPDKIADRIAGALVDYCYSEQDKPSCAFEVLVGHRLCVIMGESSIYPLHCVLRGIVDRIAGVDVNCLPRIVSQDTHLEQNRLKGARCGDNGIFKGVYLSPEEVSLADFSRELYEAFPYDGKMVRTKSGLTICQSHMTDAEAEELEAKMEKNKIYCRVNPLGPWTGGIDVDSGATNRKLGSDMGRAVTGGGIHGKDLSKADVTVNIVCHLRAQAHRQAVSASCSIGDEYIHLVGDDGYYEELSFASAMHQAKGYIDGMGGFEKLAEWGFI